MIAALDEAEVEFVGCLDDIAICEGEIADGVLVLGELKDVGAFATDQGVLALTAKEVVVAAAER